MLTVTKLASRFKISRTTILYYEKAGLLKPAYRSDNGYRWYGEMEINRLESIVTYRSYGLSIESIANLLEQNGEVSQFRMLREHLNKLEAEINQLRGQQRAIINLLQEPNILKKNAVTKEKWVEIMLMSGFSDADMANWHQKFETMEPDKHQLFLESLGIGKEEIKRIRNL